MKILQMHAKNTGSESKAFGSDLQSDTLPFIWAVEGNLARAVQVLHAEQAISATVSEEACPAASPDREACVVLSPQTSFYRSYTEAMLRRYAVLSMESGRVPSLIGREMFRGKVTSYRVHAFDDVVIFVHDVEKCIRTLAAEQQKLILRIGIQEYTFSEMSERLGCSIRTVQRHYTEALDELTAVFLERRLLERIASHPCQEGAGAAKLVSHCP